MYRDCTWCSTVIFRGDTLLSILSPMRTYPKQPFFQSLRSLSWSFPISRTILVVDLCESDMPSLFNLVKTYYTWARITAPCSLNSVGTVCYTVQNMNLFPSGVIFVCRVQAHYNLYSVRMVRGGIYLWSCCCANWTESPKSPTNQTLIATHNIPFLKHVQNTGARKPWLVIWTFSGILTSLELPQPSQ